MATDDDNRDETQDPWDGIEADDFPDLSSDSPLAFEEEPLSAEAGIGGDTPPFVEEEGEPAAARSAGDSDIDAWLTEGQDKPGPSLSVFQEDDSAAFAEWGEQAGVDRSSVEIGTGNSGVPSPSSIDVSSVGPESESMPDFSPFTAEVPDGGAEEAAWESPLTESSAAVATDGEAFGFEEVTTANEWNVETGSAAGETFGGDAAAAAQPRKKKSGGVGSLVGIVAGGLLAIPITLGILLWGFGRDPFGVAALVPDSLAFLVPNQFRPADFGPVGPVALAVAEPVAAGAEPAPPAEPLSAADEADAGDDALSDEEPAPAVADAEPTDEDLADTETLADTDMVEPEPLGESDMADMVDLAIIEPEPVIDAPAIETDVPVMAFTVVEPPLADEEPVAAAAPLLAMLDERSVAEPVLPVEPEPEPLDVTALDAAAAEVSAVTAEVAAIEDTTGPAQGRQLVAWYRSLAGYAESLSLLEQEAVETDRSLDPAAGSMMAVHREIADHPELHPHLARLTRDWIGYPRRQSDGVVVPGAFRGARRVGPFWRSEVRVGDTEGRPDIDLVVVTRAEPAAAVGETVVITGLALDGGVIWAANLQGVAAEKIGEPGL